MILNRGTIYMAKDWEQYKNVVNPVWNNGYQRYDLSMDEVIQKIKVW